MAISTLDGLIAGARAPEDILKIGNTMEASGVWYSLAYVPGAPGAAVAPAPGINGAALTSYAGQIPFSNPGGGLTTYLSRLLCVANGQGTFRVYDRLWHNSGIAVATTTAQAITPVAIPARDRAGAALGAGVMAALEVSTATTNAGSVSTITISYTNSAGVAGRTGTMPAFPATAVVGTFVPFALQAGDAGIRSIESITLGTSLVTGAVHLVLYRSILTLGVASANVSAEVNAVTGGMPQLYDNTVPFMLWLPVSTAAVTISAQLAVAQG